MTDSDNDVITSVEDEDYDVESADLPIPDFERPPDPQLVAEGWERRFMADARRLKEYTELYASMGFEVRAEPIRLEEIGPDCGDCSLVLYRLFVTIYTRRPPVGTLGLGEHEVGVPRPRAESVPSHKTREAPI
ncbi:MAG TPA: hypothetical protein VJ754_05170 [Anaerolineae bacterium]|nr:hypothetical protein [Anaerolineae bacterium]